MTAIFTRMFFFLLIFKKIHAGLSKLNFRGYPTYKSSVKAKKQEIFYLQMMEALTIDMFLYTRTTTYMDGTLLPCKKTIFENCFLQGT